MTATLVADGPTVSEAPPAARRIAAQIARVEGVRLVRNPPFILGALAAVALLVVMTTGDAPVLHRDDVLAGASLYPLAGITLMLTNLATLRRRRSDTADVEDAAVAPRASVTTGLLWSVGWAVAAAALVVGVELAILRGMGGIWAPSALEILVGPAMVGLLGVLGVALGSWLPSRLTAPLAVVVIGALEIWLTSPTFSTDVRLWLALWPPESSLKTPELAFRPAGWHVVYLAGMAGIIGSIAVVRHGVRSSRVAVAVVGLLAAVGGAIGQVSSDAVGERAGAFVRRALQDEPVVCSTIGGLRYCAHPAYAAWIPRWAGVVEGVQSIVPGDPLDSVREVRQSLYQFTALEDILPGTLWVGPTWGRFSRAGEFELSLALSVAQLAVGLPSNEGIPVEHRLNRSEARQWNRQNPRAEPYRTGDSLFLRQNCKAPEQARMVTALWLAARATPGSEAALRRVLERQPLGFHRDADGEGVDFAGALAYELQSGAFQTFVIPARSDVVRAVQMLDAGERIEPLVRVNREAIVDPRTSANDLARLLDLEPLPDLRAQLDAALVGQRPIVAKIAERDFERSVRADGTLRIPRNEGPKLTCP